MSMDPRTRALLEAPIASTLLRLAAPNASTLLRLAAPNMLVLVAQAAAGLVETYFIGKLAAVASGSWFGPLTWPRKCDRATSYTSRAKCSRYGRRNPGRIKD